MSTVRRHGEARPEGPNVEAQRAEAGSGVLGKGSSWPPPHRLWGRGEAM